MKIIDQRFWVVWASVVILSACDSKSQQVETTDLGTEVNFVRKSDGEALEDQRILRVNMKFTTAAGEVITQSKDDDPMFMQFRRDTLNSQGQFPNVLEIMSVGDSCTFEIPAKDVFETTFGRPVPDSIDEASLLKFELGIAEQVTMEEYQQRVQALQRKLSEEQLQIDGEKIEKYLADNGISGATTTDSGLRYMITEEGSGPIPERGQKVNVKYAGRYLDNGEQFDAGEFSFVLGSGQVIRGWDEGLGYLSVGSKGVLYIPSPLAYAGGGRGIPPNSVLIFDVELLGID